MITINELHIHVHQKVDVEKVLNALGGLASGQAAMLVRLKGIEMANAEQTALLNEIDAFTNQLAETLNSQGEQLTEIGSDLDELIAATNDPALTAKLTELRDRVSGTVTTAQTTSATLTQLAAKHDAPIPPPPVEG